MFQQEGFNQRSRSGNFDTEGEGPGRSWASLELLEFPEAVWKGLDRLGLQSGCGLHVSRVCVVHGRDGRRECKVRGGDFALQFLTGKEGEKQDLQSGVGVQTTQRPGT